MRQVRAPFADVVERVHDFDGFFVRDFGVGGGIVLHGERGEVAFIDGIVAEKLVFARAQIYTVKGGRCFLAAGGFGVGIEIDGNDFAVADGQPSAVAQVFARIELDLGGLGEQAGNMVFKAAVALGIQRQGFAFGGFQVQAVEIGRVQRFEEVGQFFSSSVSVPATSSRLTR